MPSQLAADTTSVIEQHPAPVTEEPLPIRRSTRNHKTPSHLQDFVCSYTNSSWYNLVPLSSEHIACISAIEQYPELVSYKLLNTLVG